MRFNSKTKQKAMDYNFMSKNRMCTGKKDKQKVGMHKKDDITLIKLPKLSAFSS